MKTATVYACSNIGLSGAKVYVQESAEGFEARQAVAIFGSYQMLEAELERIQYNPFHVDFNDNFACGKGVTKEAALEALNADAKSMSDSLWL